MNPPPTTPGPCCCEDHDITSWDEIRANPDTPIGHGSIVKVPMHEVIHEDTDGEECRHEEYEVICPLCPLHASAPDLLAALRWCHDRIHPPHADGRLSCAITCPGHAAIARAARAEGRLPVEAQR